MNRSEFAEKVTVGGVKFGDAIHYRFAGNRGPGAGRFLRMCMTAAGAAERIRLEIPGDGVGPGDEITVRVADVTAWDNGSASVPVEDDAPAPPTVEVGQVWESQNYLYIITNVRDGEISWSARDKHTMQWVPLVRASSFGADLLVPDSSLIRRDVRVWVMTGVVRPPRAGEWFYSDALARPLLREVTKYGDIWNSEILIPLFAEDEPAPKPVPTDNPAPTWLTQWRADPAEDVYTLADGEPVTPHPTTTRELAELMGNGRGWMVMRDDTGASFVVESVRRGALGGYVDLRGDRKYACLPFTTGPYCALVSTALSPSGVRYRIDGLRVSVESEPETREQQLERENADLRAKLDAARKALD